jgi:glycosyltransferase involved in cell wall biosynthesis
MAARIERKGFSVSVVLPIYNEVENVDPCLAQITAVLRKITEAYEVICVNDGSTDATLERLVEHHRKNPRIKVINLSRNFGKDKALTAGIDFSSGDAVIPIDADLQDPPSLIEKMLEKWQEGFDVVYATRNERAGESILKRMTAASFYRSINAISEIPIPKNTGDFRLLDRRVVDALRELPENARFMKGIFSWVGFRQCSVLYDRQCRFGGRTKWNYWKLWNFALDGLTSFSSVPIRIWTYLGLLISMMSFGYAIFVIVRVLVIGIEAPGYASLMVVTLFLGGIILMGLGFMGEYIGRIFNEVKRRPLYLVRDVWGISNLHGGEDGSAGTAKSERLQ